MGAKTKIGWADATWNPVTGCNHDCEYCYARRQAVRFGGFDHDEDKKPVGTQLCIGVQELDKPKYITRGNGLQKAPYPWFFCPTFHHYRLDEPQHWKETRTIFVGSMCDLFGDWVPDEWIKAVFEACEKAPQHRYLFLTKNPARYIKLAKNGHLPKNSDNMWFGSTVAKPGMKFFDSSNRHTFLSVEPILEPFSSSFGAGLRICKMTDWIIIGAETGNRKDKVVPKASWIMEIVQSAEKAGTPVFMKESLRGIMGDCFRQEFPW